ncbi:hypothetical protein CTE07_08670 [Chitinophaga terrae (ex Kim and Jung 2007)]|nr:hypothetical protein CTE07_08670 [Chitinophaga terrae (ex Kim and Jung 2007)]
MEEQAYPGHEGAAIECFFAKGSAGNADKQIGNTHVGMADQEMDGGGNNIQRAGYEAGKGDGLDKRGHTIRFW